MKSLFFSALLISGFCISGLQEVFSQPPQPKKDRADTEFGPPPPPSPLFLHPDGPPRRGPDGRGPDGPPFAGRERRGPSPLGIFGIFVKSPAIREYLQLNAEQIRKIEEENKQVQKAFQNRMEELTEKKFPHEWSPEMRRKFVEEMPALIEKMSKDYFRKMDAILSSEQMEKAKEVLFIISGGLDAPIFESTNFSILRLNDEQKSQLKSIQTQTVEEFRSLVEEFRKKDRSETTRKDFFTRLESLQKKTNEKVVAVLTEEQKAQAQSVMEKGKELKEKFESERPKRFDRKKRGERG